MKRNEYRTPDMTIYAILKPMGLALVVSFYVGLRLLTELQICQYQHGDTGDHAICQRDQDFVAGFL